MLDAERIDPATVKLSDFVDTADPQAVLSEVKTTARMANPDMEFKFLTVAVDDASALRRRVPGYRQQHELPRPTMEVLLATAGSCTGRTRSART